MKERWHCEEEVMEEGRGGCGEARGRRNGADDVMIMCVSGKIRPKAYDCWTGLMMFDNVCGASVKIKRRGWLWEGE